MNQNEQLGVFDGTQVVRFERLLPGPIERVWAYLTESDKRSLWLASGAMPRFRSPVRAIAIRSAIRRSTHSPTISRERSTR